MSLRTSILMLLFLLLAPVLIATNVHAATRPATEDDCKIIRAAGGSCQPGVTPYDPATPGVSRSGADAKAELQKRCPTCNFGPQFNDKFAVCAAGYFNAFEKAYPGSSVRITSAFRSADHERKICVNNPACGAQMNNPNPKSNHINGIAIDVWPSGSACSGGNGGSAACLAEFQKMWNFARANPALGVCFPFENGGPPGGSFRDRPHMILQGAGSGENGSCIRRGYSNQQCTGGPPTTVNTPAPGATPPANTPPSTGLTDIFRQALGMPTQTSALSPFAIQPFTQAASILNPFATQPATVAATPVTTQPITSGVQASPTQLAGVSDQLLGGTNSTTATGTSLADKLEGLAFGTSNSGATSGTPFIPFFGDANDKSVDTSNVKATNDRYATGTAIVALPTTFTQQGMNTQYSYSQTITSNTAYARILENLRTVLTSLLNYLRPFSAQRNQSFNAETY